MSRVKDILLREAKKLRAIAARKRAEATKLDDEAKKLESKANDDND